MKRFEDPQDELPLVRVPEQAFAVPIEMIRAMRNGGDAIQLAVRAAGLDRKEVYMALEIDPGTWSKIENDTATLHSGKIQEFCKIVGNRIYVEWINFQVGCTAVMIKTEAERLIDQLQAKLAESQAEVRILHRVLKSGGEA